MISQEKNQQTQFKQNYRFQFKKSCQWKKYLQNQGFAVIANYLNSQICNKYVEEFWEIIQQLAENKVDRNKIQTQILGKNYPPVLHGGMIQYIGHSKPQWQLRVLTQPVFSQLWNDHQLKSSFDGFCFMNGRRNYKVRQDNAFIHVDQSPTKNYLWSYQGVMTLTDSGQNEGGFVCIPKSQKFHHKFFKAKNMLDRKQNWYLFSDDDKKEQIFKKHIKLNTKAGDFILFDSRTFHCNTVPRRQVLRVCTYICMIPKKLVSQKVIQKREKAVKDRRTSNHHPGDGFKIFPQLPRYLQNPKRFKSIVKKINSYKLNEKCKKLI